MMPGDELIQACLEELRGAEGMGALVRLVGDRAAVLLGTPGVASGLVAGAPQSEDPDRVRRLRLLQALIGEAARDRDGRGRLGARFLEEAGETIEGLVAAEGLDFFGAHDLTLAYAREEVEAPDVLFSCLTEQTGPLAEPWWLPQDVDAEVDRLRQETGLDNWLVHSEMADELSAFPGRTRASFVNYVAYRDEEFCGRLALYWLLDASADVRLAAAGGFQSRVRRGVVEPASAALVPLIRNWMPPDAARAMLDDALREARHRGLFAPLEGPAPLPVRLLCTLPDRAGAQVLAVVLWSEDEPGLAMVTVEPGYGIRRAYVASAEVARVGLARLENAADSVSLRWTRMERILAAALADGLSWGRLPPPGLIDVALVCRFTQLRPRPMTARDWLAEVDPEGEIAGLEAAELDVLVERSASWHDDHVAVGGWHEGTAVFEDALTESRHADRVETAFWTRVEERREDWATLMLRAADVLKGTEDGDWRSFAATAVALLDGRAFVTVPIMRRVLEATTEAWRAEEHRRWSEDEDGTAELQRLVAAAEWPEGEHPMAAPSVWLDGYLAAAALSPLGPRVEALFSALAERAATAAGRASDRAVARMKARYDELQAAYGVPRFVKDMLAVLDAGDLADWAKGFACGISILEADWDLHEFPADDRFALTTLAGLAARATAGPGVREHLAEFVGRRAASRHGRGA